MAIRHCLRDRIGDTTGPRQHTVMLALCALLLSTAGVSAQTPDRELALDFRPFAGALSIAWRTSDAWSIGLALGGGIDELDRTLVPDTDDPDYHAFEQYLHAAVFARHKPSQRIDLDVGLRGGFADVRTCGASDCWPGLYAGAYAGAFWGGRRWKLGPRLLVGRVYEHPYSDTVVYMEILTGRFSFGW
jgi:hypothetical protein